MSIRTATRSTAPDFETNQAPGLATRLARPPVENICARSLAYVLLAWLAIVSLVVPAPALAAWSFASVGTTSTTYTMPSTEPEPTEMVNLGNLGLSTGPHEISLDPGSTFEEPPPPIPEAPPPLRNPKAAFDWVSLDAVTEPGTTNQLYSSPSTGGPWTFRQNLPADTRTEIREEGLALGERVCFQLRSQGGPIETTDSLCVRSDDRVGFERREMSPEASERIVEAFRWSDTLPVSNGDDAEQPALYAMAALIGVDAFLQDIQDLGIHVQSLPLFPTEFPSWNSEQAVFTIGEDDVRAWRFVVVPGFIYNAIRERNIAREAQGLATSVLVFREIVDPRAKYNPYGSHRLDYTFLRDQYFEYNGEVTDDACLLGDPNAPCPLWLGSLFREFAELIVDGIDGLIDGVRQIHGYFDRKLGEEVELTVHFDVQHAQFGFSGVMRSGWSGAPLTLEGATIQVRQGFSMFKGDVNTQGFMRRLVADSNDTSFCIELENDAVEITEFLTEKTICLDGDYVVERDLELTVPVKHKYASTFAAITDAHHYMRDVVGLDMSQVKVLTGWQADLLTIDDLSYAPCLGSLGLGVGDFVPIVGQVAELLLGGIDIVLSTNDAESRGVPVHEYGHAVMCELMRDQGRAFFETAWTDVILGIFDKSPDNESWVVNEAFADFVSSQVLGATNYVAPTNSQSQGGMNYALSGTGGLEQNFQQQSSPTLPGQVGLIASILHDLFDGHGDQPEPNDGSHWDDNGAVLFWDGGLEDSDRADEEVNLVGSALLDLLHFIDGRGQTLGFDTFLGGLEELAIEEGFSGFEVCEAFALHYPGGDCPNYSGMNIATPVIVNGSTTTTGTLGYGSVDGGTGGTTTGNAWSTSFGGSTEFRMR